MGNLTGQTQQELTDSLQGEYQVQSHPYLLNRSTNQLCTLHKITTNSAPHSHRVAEIITEYSRSRCESISKLRAHYLLDKRGVCSDEEHYFLVFSGQNSYSLKDEVIKRRFYQKPFREEEIRHIVETYLCGLREYNQRFQRDCEKLSLDSVALDVNSKRIYLKDPWLCNQGDQEHADNLSQLMQSYPSPQKLGAALSPKVVSFNEFLSNLFSVGVISLQLKRLDFADTVYNKKRELNVEDIRSRLMQFRDEKLRRGIELLLDVEPNRRKEVYMIWGVQNREEHYLVPISQQYRTSQEQDLAVTQKKQAQRINMNPQLNPPQHYPSTQVSPKQVESIYIPAVPSHHRSQTQTNIHFQSHPNRAIPNSNQICMVPPGGRPQENIYPEGGKLETAKSFVSFKDYFNQEDHKPQSYPTTAPNTIQFQRNTSPQGRNPQGYSRPITQPQHQIYKPRPSPVYETYKQSFPLSEFPLTQPQLQFQTPPVHQNAVINQANGIKKQNVQNPLDILTKNEETRVKVALEVQNKKGGEAKEINGVQGKETKSSPNYVKTTSDSKQVSPLKEEKGTEEVKSSAQTETSPSKHHSSSPNPNISETDTFFLKQEEKETTPKRKTQKNRYNSTIVEVRDEDTPDHSAKSEDIIEEEYVAQEYETGSRYEGFKSGGMRNGRGRFFYQDGGYYEGQWRNNKMDGYGKLFYEGGKLAYEGQWSQDQFNGLGKVYNDNPVVFHDNFDYTNFDYLQDYWQYYEGMLSRDTKQGRGRIKLSNGQIFQGDFHEDKIQGFGKFHTTEGKTIEGIWRQSKLVKIISNG